MIGSCISDYKFEVDSEIIKDFMLQSFDFDNELHDFSVIENRNL
jgi:hypothetical protein